MKKYILIICVILFTSTVLSGETVLISTGEYAPYTTKKLMNNGFVNHVITEAFKLENYKVKYTYLPWKRAYKEMVKGEFHASSYWYASKKREKETYYSEPIFIAREYFFYLKSKPFNWSKLQDLKGKHVGAMRGNTYTSEFWELGKRNILHIQVVGKDLQNFQKLLLGRIDLFPTSLLVANNIMKNKLNPKEIDMIAYHPKPLLQTKAFLLFSKVNKDSSKLLKTFDSGMKKLINQGIYDKLYKNFLNGKYNR